MRGLLGARARMPTSVSRILGSSRRRIDRARSAGLRSARRRHSAPMDQLPRTLARVTRLASARADAGRHARGAVAPQPWRLSRSAAPVWDAPAPAPLVAAEPHQVLGSEAHPVLAPPESPAPTPAWWSNLREEFGVSDWALEQLFGTP